MVFLEIKQTASTVYLDIQIWYKSWCVEMDKRWGNRGWRLWAAIICFLLAAIIVSAFCLVYGRSSNHKSINSQKGGNLEGGNLEGVNPLFMHPSDSHNSNSLYANVSQGDTLPFDKTDKVNGLYKNVNPSPNNPQDSGYIEIAPDNNSKSQSNTGSQYLDVKPVPTPPSPPNTQLPPKSSTNTKSVSFAHQIKYGKNILNHKRKEKDSKPPTNTLGKVVESTPSPPPPPPPLPPSISPGKNPLRNAIQSRSKKLSPVPKSEIRNSSVIARKPSPRERTIAKSPNPPNVNTRHKTMQKLDSRMANFNTKLSTYSDAKAKKSQAQSDVNARQKKIAELKERKRELKNRGVSSKVVSREAKQEKKGLKQEKSHLKAAAKTEKKAETNMKRSQKRARQSLSQASRSKKSGITSTNTLDKARKVGKPIKTPKTPKTPKTSSSNKLVSTSKPGSGNKSGSQSISRNRPQTPGRRSNTRQIRMGPTPGIGALGETMGQAANYAKKGAAVVAGGVAAGALTLGSIAHRAHKKVIEPITQQ